MVWKATGSALYQAVERHNREETNPPEPQQSPEPCCAGTAPHKSTACCTGMSPKPQSGLAELLGDRDFLIIAAVILILLHEKADNKLILALAFVLFS